MLTKRRKSSTFCRYYRWSLKNVWFVIIFGDASTSHFGGWYNSNRRKFPRVHIDRRKQMKIESNYGILMATQARKSMENVKLVKHAIWHSGLCWLWECNENNRTLSKKSAQGHWLIMWFVLETTVLSTSSHIFSHAIIVTVCCDYFTNGPLSFLH